MSRDREIFVDEIGKKIKREISTVVSGSADAYTISDHQYTSTTNISEMGRIHVAPPGILNTIIPCAACKLLRRRCAEECPFSPYFSPHEPHKFASVHKVFGASNVSKMLMDVPECQRADAANSLVYEANLRIRDPVYGCMGAISALQQQIQSLQAELNAVRNEILKYKYGDHHHHHHHHHHHQPTSNSMIINSSNHAALITPNNNSVPAISSNLLPHRSSPAPPPPPPLPPPPSIVISSSSSTTTSSLYTQQPSSSGGYSSISSDHNNVPYFD